MGIAATEGAASRLAIDGGPRAVTVPAGDRWESVTELERSYVSAALDDVKSVYDQIELFEREFREGVGSRHALAVCNGTAALHSAIFANRRIQHARSVEDPRIYVHAVPKRQRPTHSINGTLLVHRL